jgi:uncharacterized protein (TIGR02246 family)
MKHRLALISVCGAVALLTGCNQMPDTRDADAKALKDNEAQWNLDWAAKDIDKVMAHYADNAVLMTPGTPVASGKDAIRKGLQMMMADPALSLKFQPSRVEVARSSDIAYTQGTYTLTLTEPATKQLINDHGTYVTTYAKQPDGTWKAVVDMADSEVPPPAPPMAPPPKK